ncbi:MAG: Na+/H+ antiporter subunit E [Phototrophicaceae bacterium]|jgi:multisubunit Na+/H+ antiporter MnhE subunit
MQSVILLAIPGGLVFMALTNQYTWQGYIVGMLLSGLALLMGRADTLRLPMHPRRLVSVLVGWVVYIALLLQEVFNSAVSVSKIVLSRHPEDHLDPGLIRVPTQDATHNEIITALSAHAITITPGQLIVDIERDGDDTVLIVHNVNAGLSAKTIHQEQTTRLARIRKALGDDE